MGGEDRRAPERHPDVDLGHRQPLDVQHVCLEPRERGRHADVLARLQRQPRPRAPKEPRRERVEPLDPLVALRGRQLGEAEVGGMQLDLCPGAPERGRELVVVPRRVGRRIGDDDTHRWPTVGEVLVRTWNLFHGNTNPPRRAAYLREMVETDQRRQSGRRLPAGDPGVGAAEAPRLDGHAGRDRACETGEARAVPDPAHRSAGPSPRRITGGSARASRARGTRSSSRRRPRFASTRRSR